MCWGRCIYLFSSIESLHQSLDIYWQSRDWYFSCQTNHFTRCFQTSSMIHHFLLIEKTIFSFLRNCNGWADQIRSDEMEWVTGKSPNIGQNFERKRWLCWCDLGMWGWSAVWGSQSNSAASSALFQIPDFPTGIVAPKKFLGQKPKVKFFKVAPYVEVT